MKAMKYIALLHIGAISAICLIMTSCNSFLDEMPDNRTELTTEESITKILVSAYPETTNCHIGEFYSDNIDENSKAYSYLFRLNEHLYRWQQTTEEDQDSPHALWEACYNAISSANQALQAIEEMGNPTSLSAQKGEALVCRAYGHFLLVTTFCKAYSTTSGQDLGIPYIEKPETTVNPQYSRGNVAEVYKKIANDLKEGLPLIDDNIYSRAKYHFNKKAAYAFAARFYLYYMQQDYSNCQKVIEYANIILGNNASRHLRDWAALGSLSPNKDIQPNAYVDADNQANLLVITAASYWPMVADPGYISCEAYCNNEITASENCKSEGPWGDQTSYQQTPFAPSSSIKNGFRRLAIYRQFTVSGDSWSGNMMYPPFTTDETLLCRAEAYALLKRYDEAAEDIDAWQKAFTTNTETLTKESINDFYAGLPYYQPENPTVKKELHPDFIIENGMQENLIHCILHARRLLTLEEGLRWQDIKRYGIVIYRRYFEGYTLVRITDKMEVNDPRRAVQLPTSVITAGMEPNPRNN